MDVETRKAGERAAGLDKRNSCLLWLQQSDPWRRGRPWLQLPSCGRKSSVDSDFSVWSLQRLGEMSLHCDSLKRNKEWMLGFRVLGSIPMLYIWRSWGWDRGSGLTKVTQQGQEPRLKPASLVCLLPHQRNKEERRGKRQVWRDVKIWGKCCASRITDFEVRRVFFFL